MGIGVTVEEPLKDEEGKPLPANYADRIINTFILFLREVFSTNDDYRYSEDESKTDLLIFDSFADNLDSVGRKPTLVTDLEPILKSNRFLDDRGGFRHPEYYLDKTYKTDLFATALTIHCISQEHDESRTLSFLVGTVIFGLEDVLLARGIQELSVETVVGKPVKLITSNRGEFWSTPSTIRITFQDNWVNSIIGGEVLKNIRLTITEKDLGGPTGCE